jgi:hypothetical protein
MFHKNGSGVEHAGEVLAERPSADELTGRNAGQEFERALLDPISEIAPPSNSTTAPTLPRPSPSASAGSSGGDSGSLTPARASPTPAGRSST